MRRDDSARGAVVETCMPGIGRRTAEAIVVALSAPSQTPAAVNVTTGEILDDGAPTLAASGDNGTRG